MNELFSEQWAIEGASLITAELLAAINGELRRINVPAGQGIGPYDSIRPRPVWPMVDLIQLNDIATRGRPSTWSLAGYGTRKLANNRTRVSSFGQCQKDVLTLTNYSRD